jgi:hypothetical protein
MKPNINYPYLKKIKEITTLYFCLPPTVFYFNFLKPKVGSMSNLLSVQSEANPWTVDTAAALSSLRECSAGDHHLTWHRMQTCTCRAASWGAVQALAAGPLQGGCRLAATSKWCTGGRGSSSRAAGRAVEVIHTNNDLDGRLVISSHTNNARAAVPMETV